MYVAGTDIGLDPAAGRQLAGICPQHDALWPTLTAAEHLAFYVRVKVDTPTSYFHKRNHATFVVDPLKY